MKLYWPYRSSAPLCSPRFRICSFFCGDIHIRSSVNAPLDLWFCWLSFRWLLRHHVTSLTESGQTRKLPLRWRLVAYNHKTVIPVEYYSLSAFSVFMPLLCTHQRSLVSAESSAVTTTSIWTQFYQFYQIYLAAAAAAQGKSPSIQKSPKTFWEDLMHIIQPDEPASVWRDNFLPFLLLDL